MIKLSQSTFTLNDNSYELVEIKLASGKNLRLIVENDKLVRLIADHNLRNKNPITEDELEMCPTRAGLDSFYHD